MSDDTTESSPLSDRRLRLVYLAGIALNVIALASAVLAREWLVSVTFGVILVYLAVRYRTIPSS